MSQKAANSINHDACCVGVCVLLDFVLWCRIILLQDFVRNDQPHVSESRWKDLAFSVKREIQSRSETQGSSVDVSFLPQSVRYGI